MVETHSHCEDRLHYVEREHVNFYQGGEGFSPLCFVFRVHSHKGETLTRKYRASVERDYVNVNLPLHPNW